MIVLKSTDTLEVKLGGAKLTLDNPVTVHYADMDTTTLDVSAYDRQLNNTNGTTTVVICTAPSAGKVRLVKKLTLAVMDTASIALTMQINNGSALFVIVPGTIFAVGDLLQDDGE